MNWRAVVFGVLLPAAILAAEGDKASPAEAIELQCPKLVASGFFEGAPVHLSVQEVEAWSKRALGDLDVAELSKYVGKSTITSLAKTRLNWLFSHRLRSNDQIRQRQQSIQELAASPELRAQIEAALQEYAEFEKGNLGWDKVLRWFGAPVHGAPTDQYFEKYKTARKPTLFTKVLSAMFDYIAPATTVSSLLGNIKGSLATIGIFAYHNTKNQSARRRELSHFQQIVVTAGKAASSLMTAKSPHLQEVGQVLAALRDPADPMKLRNLSRGLSWLRNGTVSSVLFDLVYVSNFSLPLVRRKALQRIEEFGVLASALAELDCYLALAKVYADHPDMVFPELIDPAEPSQLEIVDGHHPYLYWENQPSIPNSVQFSKQPDANQPWLYFLTGPNARGKSTYLRMIGLNTLLAQMGMPVAARSMRLSPVVVFTALRKSDSTASSESTFVAEAKTMAALLKESQETPHSLLLLDEIYTGTSLNEQLAAEEGTLHHLSAAGQFTIMASHKRHNATVGESLPGFANIHVSDDDAPERKYRIEPGVSSRYNAVDVMREEGVPEELLEAVSRYLADAP